MSIVAPEPPPPPPPPPPPSTTPPTFDFVRPLAFVFDDPRWIAKILLGGVFVLASAFLIGIFFVYGYMARLVRNVIDGVEHPLPEWEDLGEYFAEGLRLFFVTLLYSLPFAIIAGIFIIPAAMMGSLNEDAMRQWGGGMMSCFMCILFPLGLALAIWMPGALIMAVVSRSFSAGFEFSRIWAFIRANIGNYLLAFVIWIIARFAASIVGLAALCIGILFTEFWAMVVGAYAFAQTYRLSTVK